MSQGGILAHVDATLDARGARALDLIRIPCVWTDPARARARGAASAGTGSSIPITGALLVGFGRIDKCIHPPNVKYDLPSYCGGIRSWSRNLDALSRCKED